VVRILALLRMLAQGLKPSVHELAAEFRTRRETIYRDLRALQDAGYPISGDEHGRLSRPRLLPSPVPDIRFSRAEFDALLFATAQAQAALPTAESLSSATNKIKALANCEDDPVRFGLDGIFEARTSGSKDYRSHENRIALLIEAILRKRRCRVQYRTPLRTEPKTYEFDPYRILCIDGGLYVVGRVPTHTGTVTLSIDRLAALEVSMAEFEVDATYDPEQCRRDAFGVCWNDPMDVVLRFRADQAPYVRERQWHPTQKIADLPDGGIQLAFRAGGSFEIRRWILGWGDAVEVISPDELRQAIRKILISASSFYRS
jgi:proteasome accessory factor B